MPAKADDPKTAAPPAGGENPPAPSAPADAASSAGAVPAVAQKRDDVHPDPTRYGDWERKGRCIDF